MKTKGPLVSCLMPTYNRSEYLAEALNSLVEQTYKNIEIIVVDDGSTDSTDTLMKWFVDKYPKIEYFQCAHRGIAATRNFAINQALGAYIAVCDSDDMYAKQRIKKQVTFLEKNKDIDFSYSGYMEADEHMVGIRTVAPPVDFKAEDIRDNNTIPHATIMARRDCFVDNPYDGRFTSNDDKKLLWDWFKAGYKGKVVKEMLYLKRNHIQTVSNIKAVEVNKFNLELDAEINEYLDTK